jgi:poly(3-hydroxybutyrate) depolymerase
MQLADQDMYFIFQLPPDLSEYKAVMVWLHGGAFSFGSGNTEIYGPDYLMEGDVVLVTVNYRLGPLGNHNQAGWIHIPQRIRKSPDSKCFFSPTLSPPSQHGTKFMAHVTLA